MKKLFVILIMAITAHYGSLHAQSVSYTPPENYEAGSDEKGNEIFTNSSAASIIQISVTKGVSLSAFLKSFSEEQFVNQNLIVLDKKSIDPKTDNEATYTAQVFVCSYFASSDDESKQTEFIRLIWFTGNDSCVVMAVATFPAMAKELLMEPITNSFKRKLTIL